MIQIANTSPKSSNALLSMPSSIASRPTWDFFKMRFVTSYNFISDGVRGETHGFYSHVEMILPDDTYLGALAHGGVQIRPWDYCSVVRERRYAIPVPGDKLALMTDFAKRQVGKKYDLLNIAGLALDKDWHHPDEWICSRLVTAIAEAGGLFLLNVLPGNENLVTPEMLHLSPYLLNNCYYQFGT